MERGLGRLMVKRVVIRPNHLPESASAHLSVDNSSCATLVNVNLSIPYPIGNKIKTTFMVSISRSHDATRDRQKGLIPTL
jgi:hypothetical protein